jgi:hypothetical protein
MMSMGFASLLGLFGLTSAFAVVGLVLAGWMAWRIVEKAGLPGWAGLGAVLLTLTAVGTVVPLILLWVFAFMRWPRDELAGATPPGSGVRAVLPPPVQTLADARGWQLSGNVASGSSVSLSFDGHAPSYLLTGAPAAGPTELSVPDPSVGQPHARLLMAGTRLGLEDLGTSGGTYIDGARLLPEHGPRDISASRTIRVGKVELALSRA